MRGDKKEWSVLEVEYTSESLAIDLWIGLDRLDLFFFYRCVRTVEVEMKVIFLNFLGGGMCNN